MSVQELKKELVQRCRRSNKQNYPAAFLFHLRHKAVTPEYQATVDRRAADKDPSHWLTPEEFEKRLDHN